MEKIFLNNPLENWIYAVIFLVATIIVAKLFQAVLRNSKKRLEEKGKLNLPFFLIDLLEKPLVFAIVIFGVWLALHQLTFGARFDQGIDIVYYILITINVAWFVANLFNTFVEKYAKSYVARSQSEVGMQVLPLLKSVVNILVWVIAIIFALQQAGYDAAALLAGLGIGGLALALAAKDSAANIFGGVAVFMDKTFKVGDRIKVRGYDGIIMEIGIRVTKMQTFDGTIITIPNSVFSNNEVENVSMEPSRRIVMNLGLTYDTPPEKMHEAMEILKDIVTNNEQLDEKVLVSFNGFNDSSLNILLIYYILKTGDILGAQTEVNSEILKRFNEKGLDFAFPTVTQYNIEQK